MRPLIIILVAAFVLLQYLLWFADNGIMQVFHLKREIEQKQEKNTDIKKHNAVLQDEIDSLKKGGEAIEGRARNDLGMIKDGEVFYQLVK